VQFFVDDVNPSDIHVLGVFSAKAIPIKELPDFYKPTILETLLSARAKSPNIFWQDFNRV
jgi:hypothetical protein